jgi:hypothetical protein
MTAIRGWAGLSQGAPLSQLHSQHAKPPGKLAEAVRLRLDSATPQTRRTRADVSESHQSLPSLRSSDELSLSPLKIIRYCLPVHAAPRREFQRNIGTPQCSTTQAKRLDNPPKVNEAGYMSTSELPLAGSISCMGLSDVEPEDETSPTELSGAAHRRLISSRQTSIFARD